MFNHFHQHAYDIKRWLPMKDFHLGQFDLVRTEDGGFMVFVDCELAEDRLLFEVIVPGCGPGGSSATMTRKLSPVAVQHLRMSLDGEIWRYYPDAAQIERFAYAVQTGADDGEIHAKLDVKNIWEFGRVYEGWLKTNPDTLVVARVEMKVKALRDARIFRESKAASQQADSNVMFQNMVMAGHVLKCHGGEIEFTYEDVKALEGYVSSIVPSAKEGFHWFSIRKAVDQIGDDGA